MVTFETVPPVADIAWKLDVYEEIEEIVLTFNTVLIQ